MNFRFSCDVIATMFDGRQHKDFQSSSFVETIKVLLRSPAGLCFFLILSIIVYVGELLKANKHPNKTTQLTKRTNVFPLSLCLAGFCVLTMSRLFTVVDVSLFLHLGHLPLRCVRNTLLESSETTH